MNTNVSQDLTNLVTQFAGEYDKFVSGNNAAGSRARKALQEVVKLSKETRKAIQEEKNKRKANKS